jgi:hypothetical protein
MHCSGRNTIDVISINVLVVVYYVRTSLCRALFFAGHVGSLFVHLCEDQPMRFYVFVTEQQRLPFAIDA